MDVMEDREVWRLNLELMTPQPLTLYLPGYFYTLFVQGGSKFALPPSRLSKNRLVA